MRTHFGKHAESTKPTPRTWDGKRYEEPSEMEKHEWRKKSCAFFKSYLTYDSIYEKFLDAFELGLSLDLLNYYEPDSYTQEPITIWDRVEKALKSKPDELDTIVAHYGQILNFTLADIQKYNKNIKEIPLAQWQENRKRLLELDPSLPGQEKEKKDFHSEHFDIHESKEVDPYAALNMVNDIATLYAQHPSALTSLITRLEKYLPLNKFPPEKHELFRSSNFICKVIAFYHPKIVEAVKDLAPEKKPLRLSVSPVTLFQTLETKSEQKEDKSDKELLIKLGETVSQSEAEEMLKTAQKKAYSDPSKTDLVIDYMNECMKHKNSEYSNPLFRGIIVKFYKKVMGEEPKLAHRA